MVCAFVVLTCSSLSAAEPPLPSCVIFFDGLEGGTVAPLARDLGHYFKTHRLLDCIDPDEAVSLLNYYDEQSRTAAFYHAVDGEIDRAKDHWFNFEFKEALAVIEHALSRMDETPQGENAAHTGDKRVEALLVKALILKAMHHRKDEVLRTFEQALAIHPKLQTSDLDFPPSYQTLFAKAKADVLSQPSGDLDISSTPPAAQVSLNGVSYGTTPLAIRTLPAGVYTLHIQTNRYLPEERKIEVRAGESTSAHIPLAFKRNGLEKPDAASSSLVLHGTLDSRETSLLALLKEAVEKGKILATDKAVILGRRAGATSAAAASWTLRILDVAHAASHRPLSASAEILGKGARLNWKALEPKLSQTLAEPLLANPHKFVDPRTGDLVVLSHTKKPLYRRPAFWVGVGLAVVGGTVGGILASQGDESGASASAGQGGVGVGLGGF
jgi:hypothetical protein